MSGHSKWHNIQGRKSVQDKKRSKIFQKLSHDLYVAAKSGGADQSSNSSLRLVMEKAKEANMPKDNVKRAIDKATGAGGIKFEDVTYGGYAPGGVAVLVQASTDNINRTVSSLRNSFSHHGGSLGTSGSVSFQFNQRGRFVINRKKYPNITEDKIMDDAIEAGAEDVKTNENYFKIYTQAADFSSVEDFLMKKGYNFDDAEITMIPKNHVRIPDANREKFEKLVDELEDNDDILAVYTTAK